MATIDGTSIFVSGGGVIALPAVLAATNISTANNQYRTWQASGAGSTLDLHNAVTITNGTNYDTHLEIQANAGGTINLAGATTVTDSTTGDLRHRSIDIAADGAGSTVNVAALINFVDNYAGGGVNDDTRSSTITATNGGSIQAGAHGAHGCGSDAGRHRHLYAPNLASATSGQLAISNISVTFAKLGDIDGSDLYASGGATLALPALHTFTNLTVFSNQSNTWQVSGGGSSLDLHNLTTITNGILYGSRLEISAVTGGTMNLAGITTITDPTTGDERRAASTLRRMAWVALSPCPRLPVSWTTRGAMARITTSGRPRWP